MRSSSKRMKLLHLGLGPMAKHIRFGTDPVNNKYIGANFVGNAKNVSIWWHHYALYFQPGDRNLFGICSLSKWAMPSVSWQGVDVRYQRGECPRMSDALHAWNKFYRFYVRCISCFSLIPVSLHNTRNPMKGKGHLSAQYKAYSRWY